jgi:hypothetical protein
MAKFSEEELERYANLEVEMIATELELLMRMIKENPVIANEYKRMFKEDYPALYPKIFEDLKFDEWLKIPVGEIDKIITYNGELKITRTRQENKESKKTNLPKNSEG